MKKYAKFWRDSASLIILARESGQTFVKNDYNYKILVFKRSEKTSFMPNSIVFPGGAVDKTDESKEWFKTYQKVGIQNEKFDVLSKVQCERPFIFEKTDDEVIDRNISLRITAIREAFEELGVLLCKTKEQIEKDKSNFSMNLSIENVPKWQTQVHDHELKFEDLCNQFKVVPDLWSLYEWSAWLTPSMFRKRRFETVFYLTALNERPEVYPEENEVQDFLWETPKSLIEAHKKQELWLAPPQLYEISRLSHIFDIDEIITFAKQRNHKGTSLYYPVQYKCSDGFVHVLPGDELYPKCPNYTIDDEDFEKYGNMTCEELRIKAKKLHRTEHNSLHDAKLFLNHEPLNGHLHPLGLGESVLAKL